MALSQVAATGQFCSPCAADAVYESVAQVLMSRSQGLMSNYQHLIYHDARVSPSLSVCEIYQLEFSSLARGTARQ